MQLFNKELSVKEVTTSLVKGVVTVVPFVGSAVTSVWSDWQSKMQYDNIMDILTKHEAQLKDIEDKVNIDYYQSEKYPSDVVQTVLKGKNEIVESKRTLYAKYLTSCCHQDNSNNKYRNEVLDIVSRIDPIHFTILRYVEENEPISNHVQTSYSITSNVSYRQQLDLQPYQVETYLDYLISLGLVRRIDITSIGNALKAIGFGKDVPHFVRTEDGYYRTSLGNAIVGFIVD